MYSSTAILNITKKLQTNTVDAAATKVTINFKILDAQATIVTADRNIVVTTSHMTITSNIVIMLHDFETHMACSLKNSSHTSSLT